MSDPSASAAEVTGPVQDGTRAHPWSLPVADLTTRGYRAEEFFLRGTARSYRIRPGTHRSHDGRWEVDEDVAADFLTRILVVRPADPSRFNGTAVLHWLNVTAGYELGTADDDELLSGYAWIGVSAQKVGIDGFPAGSPPYRGRQAPNPPLKAWDAERYRSLEHPGDAWSYDIFSQAARAVGPGRRGATDPMGGLEVQRLVAMGSSQSGNRLTSYINGVHPRTGLLDGFLLTVTAGRGTPLLPPPVGTTGTAASRPRGTPCRIRDDVEAPVMVLNTECEAVSMYGSRREDDDRFRFWEVAGAPHTVAVVPSEMSRPDGRVDNPLTYRPVTSAAYRHLHRWLTEQTPPPVQPRIRFGPESSPTIERDRHGNARGGIRLPEMEAPTAEYHGRDEDASGLGVLYGWARPFSGERLRSLYPTSPVYVRRWGEAVDRLQDRGAIRPEDADEMRTRGEKTAVELGL